MIIHVSPDAPLALRLAADTVLFAHIGSGVVGLAAGYVALAARKGQRLHRAAGRVFAPAMLVTYLVGAGAAPLIHQPANVFAGVFAAYLVASAWLTVRRAPGRIGAAEGVLCAAAAVAGLVMAVFTWFGMQNPRGIDGVPWQVGAIFTALEALSAGLDLKVIVQGGISGPARTARHLWRMCLALFIGAGSLFLGQSQVFPAPLRGSPILFLPPVLALLLMAWWLARLSSRRGRNLTARPTVAHAGEAAP